MSNWFQQSVVDPGRLRLFCFFVAFIAAFAFIRFSVRMIRAQVKWWPGNVTPGGVHIHHAVFGLVLMCVGGVGGLAVQDSDSGWAAVAAALLGIGMALLLDEFALVWFLKDVYWSEQGRLKMARARAREQRYAQPVHRLRIWFQDLIAGRPDHR
jgi:hypothetical protein